MKKAEEENKELLDFMKEALDGKVTEVKLSPRLKNSAVCLTTKGGLSLEMEKVLNQMPDGQMIKAERILELNPDHKIMETLKKTFAEDKDQLKAYAGLLYNQALLISGLSIDNPIEFSNEICNLMTK